MERGLSQSVRRTAVALTFRHRPPSIRSLDGEGWPKAGVRPLLNGLQASLCHLGRVRRAETVYVALQERGAVRREPLALARELVVLLLGLAVVLARLLHRLARAAIGFPHGHLRLAAVRGAGFFSSS